MVSLPDDAFVVRGGINSTELLENGSGVIVDSNGILRGASVNCAADKTVQELAAELPNSKICITTVGAVRAAGGNVAPRPTPYNSDHCEVYGLSIATLHKLLMPPVDNPSRVK